MSSSSSSSSSSESDQECTAAPPDDSRSSGIISKVAYIWHTHTKKLVRQHGGSAIPSDGTAIVIHGDKNNQERYQMAFMLAYGKKGYGYIEQVGSGRAVHPKGGSTNPSNGTELEFYWGRHDGALWRFDESNDYIEHISGKFLRPTSGGNVPDNTRLMLDSEPLSYQSEFYLGDKNGNRVSIYPLEPTFIYYKPDPPITLPVLIHPRGGNSNPGENHRLVLFTNRDNPERLQFMFVPVEGQGEFGHIVHVRTGRALVGRGLHSGVVFHSDRTHGNALYKFDPQNKMIMAKNNETWYPWMTTPAYNNKEIYQGQSEAGQFYYSDYHGVPVHP